MISHPGEFHKTDRTEADDTDAVGRLEKWIKLAQADNKLSELYTQQTI